MNWLARWSRTQANSRRARWSAWRVTLLNPRLGTAPWAKPLAATIGLLTLIMALLWFGRGPLNQLQDQVAMRPIQWSALGQLLAQIRTPIPSARMVANLDDAELGAIRNLLAQQGLKPAVFQLTTDNPPRIQMQVNGVLFASLIDSLEDLRKTRNLYPVRANVQATSALGVVNASLTLEQRK